MLSLSFTNIRSIFSKRTELCSYLENSDCDILLLTETWLNFEIADTEILPDLDQFSIFRKDRDDRRGGGVLIAVRKHIVCFVIDTGAMIEILWVCIAHNTSKMIIGICYRPPDSPDTFITNLHDNIADIRRKFPKADMHLFGDFNYPDIDWVNLRSSSRNCRDFINLTLDFSFVQLVDTPTRDLNILDLVLTSAPETVAFKGCIDGFCDHRLLELTIKNTIYHTPHQT